MCPFILAVIVVAIIISSMFAKPIKAQIQDQEKKTTTVNVVAVPMAFMAKAHANKLTLTINEQETNGCAFINSETYNVVTYLYFRCTKK